MKARERFTGVDLTRFDSKFQSEDDCYRYLSEIKWPSDEYCCKRCRNTKYGKGKKPYSRRCTKCNYDESPTAGTMFDKCKISLLTAFHIVFKIGVNKDEVTSEELSKEFGMRQKTCWEFKQKVRQAMQCGTRTPYILKGEVHVHEFYLDREKIDEKTGKVKTGKRWVFVALEIAKNGYGRAYAEIITSITLHSLTSFFDKHINKNASIVMEELKAYTLNKRYKNLRQLPFDDGKNFPELQNHFTNIKKWLQGNDYRRCSDEQLQGYLDEYHFRFNRRKKKGTIFDTLICRMVAMHKRKKPKK